jgi:hypothetical protein
LSVRVGWFAIGLLILLAGCGPQTPRARQPKRLNPSGTYVHRPTGFAFPVALGMFTRSVVTEYDRDATDVSGGYDKAAGDEGVAVTVYVYPAPLLISIGSPQAVVEDSRDHLCVGAWESLKAEIVQSHPDAELIGLGTIASPSPLFKAAGHKAVFKFTGNFGGREQSLRSEADLFCYAGGRWLVAYRTTAPAAFDYRADLAALMQALRWPASLAR